MDKRRRIIALKIMQIGVNISMNINNVRLDGGLCERWSPTPKGPFTGDILEQEQIDIV